jgi:hypothetical protein
VASAAVAGEMGRCAELKDWAKSLGCCVLCSIRLAISICEWEAGRKHEMVGRCPGTRDSKGVRTTCDVIARDAWAQNPKIKTKGK